MPIIKLQTKAGEILYSGLFADIKECVEYAVRKGIDLSDVDLSYTNLGNANLDDGIFKNACLCCSSIKNVNFDEASFGATDVTNSILTYCRFSTFSVFSLSFRDTKDITGCVFKSVGTNALPISKVPIVIKGLDYPVIFTDRHVIIGVHAKPMIEWLNLHAKQDYPPRENEYAAFLKRNLDFISDLAKQHRSDDTELLTPIQHQQNDG